MGFIRKMSPKTGVSIERQSLGRMIHITIVAYAIVFRSMEDSCLIKPVNRRIR